VKRLSLVSVAAFVITATASSAAGTRPYSADRTTACLTSHRVLASPAAPSTTVPHGIPVVSVIGFSFALISGQELDHGTVVFERDAATAKRAEAALFAYSIKQAKQVRGIPMKQVKAIIREAFTLRGNAIITWENPHTKPASKRLVPSCLR
jgi:hypothetical protein